MNKILKCTLFLLILFVIASCYENLSSPGSVNSGNRAAAKENPASDFTYDLTADGKGVVIKSYTGGPGTVVIPAKIENYPVVEIANDVFNGKTTTYNFSAAMSGNLWNAIDSKENDKAGITSITIPNTVTKIGTNAFANTAITSIILPDSVVELTSDSLGNSNMFSGCNQLTEIKLSDNIEILWNIKGWGKLPVLKKINLPKNLKAVMEYTFTDCTELVEIIIPETLKEIEFKNDTAFKGCGKLPLAVRQKLRDLGYKGEF